MNTIKKGLLISLSFAIFLCIIPVQAQKKSPVTDVETRLKLFDQHVSTSIGDIALDPTNSDVVYVAAFGHEWTKSKERGVYKTTDGGKAWEKILYINDLTGAVDLGKGRDKIPTVDFEYAPGGEGSSYAIDPTNPDIVYSAGF